MKWFQVKEQSAGEKRLLLSYWLYKIFGKKVLYFIAFLVSFFTFIFAAKIRGYSKKYLLSATEYTNIKPNLINQFKHILSYANSLADKFLVYLGEYNPDNVEFSDKKTEEELFLDIKKGNGVFFICNHIGNVEIFQSFFLSKQKKPDFNINIFMSNLQSQIFNNFLNKIKVNFPTKLYPVENLGLTTGIELKENLNNGEIVFIAGDRLAQNNDNKNIKEKMFNKNILLPLGTFKLAKLMEVPTYFISVVKLNKEYKIYLERQEDLNEKALANSFVKFMEKVVKIAPFEFFHFYDFFS